MLPGDVVAGVFVVIVDDGCTSAWAELGQSGSYLCALRRCHRIASHRSSRMSCILCHFTLESSSCALLKLCGLMAPYLVNLLRGAPPSSVAKRQHLKCQCWPLQCINFYRVLAKCVRNSSSEWGLWTELCTGRWQTNKMNGIHYSMVGQKWRQRQKQRHSHRQRLFKLLLNWKCMSNITHKSQTGSKIAAQLACCMSRCLLLGGSACICTLWHAASHKLSN